VRGARGSASRWFAGLLLLASAIGVWWLVSSNETAIAKPEPSSANAAATVLHAANERSRWFEKLSESKHAAVVAKPDECTVWQALRDWAVPVATRQAQVQNDAKEAARAALIELRAMPDDRSRALSVRLSYLFEGFDSAGTSPLNETLTPEQKAQATDEAVGRYSKLAQQLVDLAVSSSDAVVYATAYLHCERSAWLSAQAKTSCARLSAAQWARIDADNAAPWMQQAQLALSAGDQAGVAEAFFRVSQAKKFTDHSRVAYQALFANLPENTPEDVMVAVSDFLIGVEAAVPASGHQTLARHCSAAQLALPGGDANRRQICAAIADMLSQRGMSLFDLGTAIRLGKNGAWPAEKLALAQTQLDELTQAAQAQTEGDSSSCLGLKKVAAYHRDWIALGEVGALRQRVVNAIPATR
jgi:hypothetical protein